ncbi:hypothetical protein C8J57DRAFT_1237610 [Mycena rebaudengoi]|nr:hypothetical protein C8J57DRAFT_1237610 [Mycena rebaudengoi]
MIRTLGGAVAISIGGAIISGVYPVHKDLSTPKTVNNHRHVACLAQPECITAQNIVDPVERELAIHTFAQSISTIWIVVTPILGAGLLMFQSVQFFLVYTIYPSLYSLAGDKVKSAAADLEKGAPPPGGVDTPGAAEADAGVEGAEKRSLEKGKSPSDKAKESLGNQI